MLYFPASAFVLVFCPLCAFACLFAIHPQTFWMGIWLY